MSTATAELSGPGRTVAGAEPISRTFAARLRRAWAEYLDYSVTLAELRSLSARELNDVGLRRENLRRTAFESVYGK